jgi:hypothetical protein
MKATRVFRKNFYDEFVSELAIFNASYRSYQFFRIALIKNFFQNLLANKSTVWYIVL